MPHVAKYKQAQVGLIIAHNFRSKRTAFKSADPKLERQNCYYVNNGSDICPSLMLRNGSRKELLREAHAFQKKRLESLPHAKRKDLVTMAEWVITCPKDIPPSKKKSFLLHSMEFIQERYGVENVVCAAMHLDEPNAQPHLHITFIPVSKDKKVCAREVLTRKELQTFHPALERYVSEKMLMKIHILKDKDERTKVSLPLSQYKIETQKKELEQREQSAKVKMDAANARDVEADKKEAEAKRNNEQASEKLQTAESLVANAKSAAANSAQARLNEYQNQNGVLRRIKDPIPFVRNMAIEIETKAELEKIEQQKAFEAEVERRNKELQEKEAALKQKEIDIQRVYAESLRIQQENEAKEKKLKERDEYQNRRTHELNKKENELNKKDDELSKKDRELIEREKEIHEICRDAKFMHKEGLQLYNEGLNMKVEYNKFQAQKNKWTKEHEHWKPIEVANEKALFFEKKYNDLNVKFSQLSKDLTAEQKQRCDDAEEYQKSLNTTIQNHQSELKKLEDKLVAQSAKHFAVLSQKDDEYASLTMDLASAKNQIDKQNHCIDVLLSERGFILENIIDDTKLSLETNATLNAYIKQSIAVATEIKGDTYTPVEPSEQEIKAQRDALEEKIHARTHSRSRSCGMSR